jgi:hypothetical protein
MSLVKPPGFHLLHHGEAWCTCVLGRDFLQDVLTEQTERCIETAPRQDYDYKEVQTILEFRPHSTLYYPRDKPCNHPKAQPLTWGRE